MKTETEIRNLLSSLIVTLDGIAWWDDGYETIQCQIATLRWVLNEDA